MSLLGTLWGTFSHDSPSQPAGSLPALHCPRLDLGDTAPAASALPDYRSESQEAFMQHFQSESWKSALPDTRGALLQEVGRRCAEEQGVSMPTVTLSSTMPDDVMGGYCGNGMIKLNEKYLDNPYKALDTVAHEVNHHAQEEHVRQGTGDTPDNLALYGCENTKRGYCPGADGSNDPDAYNKSRYYELQALEADSNNRGFSYVTANHDAFRSDPAYAEYLQDRVEYFQNLKQDLENEPEKWTEMGCDYVERARQGGCSDEMCDHARQVLESGCSESQTEAASNAEEASKLHNDCLMQSQAPQEAPENELQEADADALREHAADEQTRADEHAGIREPTEEKAPDDAAFGIREPTEKKAPDDAAFGIREPTQESDTQGAADGIRDAPQKESSSHDDGIEKGGETPARGSESEASIQGADPGGSNSADSSETISI